jgi:hypothetical protein
MKNTPILSPAEPFVGAIPGLRFHRFDFCGSHRSINAGDYVLVKPTTTYIREGEYLDLHGGIYVCQRISDGRYRKCAPFPGMSDWVLTPEEFEDEIVAYVVGVLRIQDGAVVREQMASNGGYDD